MFWGGEGPAPFLRPISLWKEGENKLLNLDRSSLKEPETWTKLGFKLPEFNPQRVADNTAKNPEWVHFGSGNIFRSFIAALNQKLLDEKKTETGIIAVDTYDPEVIKRVYRPHDNMSILVLMNADGTLDKEVIASVGESLYGDPECPEDWEKLKTAFRSPTLKMASFTITEKGYRLRSLSGDYLPDIAGDLQNGPAAPKHVMAKVCALAYERYRAGRLPIALVSMDNCSHNGEKLEASVLEVADKWAENGLVDKDFPAYLRNEAFVTFPWTMIDKITPRPSDAIRAELEKSGIGGMNVIVTAKKTYIAPFVNAESPQYLVVEDRFPNGRPPLEAAGVLFTDRATVEKTERMKVTTCLNPLHTALAIFGCLLGYKTIAEEMRDKDLVALVKRIGYQEGMPVVVNPGVLDPKAFLDEVVEKRLPNPYIPDTPQRIATDTSQKIPVRYGETIKSYAANPSLDVNSLHCIPLVIAAWFRYLLGVDDSGAAMAVSPDPLLGDMKEALSGVRVGDPSSADGKLTPLLANSKLFGLDLNKAGLGGIIEKDFKQMLRGRNAVRETLSQCIREGSD